MLTPNDCQEVLVDTEISYTVLEVETLIVNSVLSYLFTLSGITEKITVKLDDIENVKWDKVTLLKGHDVHLFRIINTNKITLGHIISPVKPWLFQTTDESDEHTWQDLNDAFDGYPEAEWNID